MTLVCFVNSLLSKPVSVIQKRVLSTLLSLVFIVVMQFIGAQFIYAQESSTATDQQTETVAPEPTATPHQTPLQQNTNTTQQNNANPAAPIGSGRHLVSVTLALMGIVGLIFALSWFVKRFSHGGFTTTSTIKILSSMPLGTRERIVLIDAGGQQLLLGITATNINTLHVFETPIVVDNKVETQSDFSRKLMAILQQKSPLTSMQDSNNKNNSAP
jgi:flagellar protein FliO/FliZ